MPIGQDEAFATHQVRIYADPETVVRTDLVRSNAGSTALLDMTVSGYFVDLP